jgi:exopolysaccharide production protein ExoQ
MGFLALLIFSFWLAWVLYHDSKARTSVSSSSWIVVVWLFIYGTRPLTSWIGWGGAYSRDEGNPEEAAVSLILIAAGLIALAKRGIRWPVVIRDNRWVFAFYLFWAMSIFWSDYPVITFKRLFKDFGYVVMVLIVLADREPIESIKAVCVRLAYLCVPVSLLLIRYFPDWGRITAGSQQDVQMYVGVTTHKNLLGVLVFVSAIFLLWDLLESAGKRRSRLEKATFASRVLVLLVCWYLLIIIDSQTSLVCAFLGTVLLIVLFKFPSVRNRPIQIEIFGLGVAAILLIVDSFIDIKRIVMEGLGRDATLTTRTDVWPLLIEFQDNPLLGQGFNTFWAGERMEQLADKTFGIIQAHNGYVETYLNGGLIGVGFLAILLLSTYIRTRKKLVLSMPDGSIRLVILLTAILHNYSEASFNKIGPLWFVTLFTFMEYLGQRSRPQISSF